MGDEKEDKSVAETLLGDLKSKVNSSNYIGVIKSIASNPPKCKDTDIQKQIGVPVVNALAKVKKSQIKELLEQMSQNEREIVLKYVYYGFQINASKATEYLYWHQMIIKKDGIGAIVRVSTDIKRNILSAADDTTQ